MATDCKSVARERYTTRSKLVALALATGLYAIAASGSSYAAVLPSPWPMNPWAAAPATPADPAEAGTDARRRWSTVPSIFGLFSGMVRAPDGSMWVGDYASPYSLLRFGEHGKVDRYYVDFPPFELVIGADGAIYAGSYYLVARVETKGGKAKRGSYVDYYLPSMGSASGSLVLAGDGNVWFTEGATSQEAVAKIATDGTITEYPVTNAYPYPGIAQGKDGKLWFGASRLNQPAVVMNFDPATGAMQSFPLSSGSCWPTYSLAQDASGELWFLCTGTGIGHLATDGSYTIYPTPGGKYGEPNFPSSLISDGRGKLWFTAETIKNGRAAGCALGSFDTKSDKAIMHPAPRSFRPPLWNPALAADGSIWASDYPIGRYTPN